MQTSVDRSELEVGLATQRRQDDALSAAPRTGTVDPRFDAHVPSRINAAPLCLIAFALVTFMFSLINAGGVSHGVVPIVISTGLIFAGFTQLAAGLIQIRSGDTLNKAKSNLMKLFDGQGWSVKRCLTSDLGLDLR